ncbi:MAG TPA: hypothetical protein VEK57_03290 [Thermoanaerobaculia bacterium]|nr:hypothetical protein [Thermoanaerobaculia bacterium]
MRRTFPFLPLLFALTLHAAEWRSSGPAGGVARVLAAAPSNPQIVYLAANSGVFRSSDGGTTWIDAGGPIVTPAALAIDPKDPDTVFASSGYEGRDVYKTTDGGRTWSRLANLPAGRTSAILIDPRDGNVVYVGSHCEPIFARGPRANFHEPSGVFKSTDGGATFQDAGQGLGGFARCVTALSFDPLDPDTLYASPVYSDSGFARSDDGAATWIAGKSVLPGRGSVADPRDPNRRYGTGSGAFVTSSDGGITWDVTQPRLLEGSMIPWFSVTDVAIDPATGRLLVATQSGVFRSGDGGASFLPLRGPAAESVNTMLFDPVTGALTVGTMTGVYRSERFPWNDWTVLHTGDASLEMRDVVTSLRDPGTAYATSRGRIYVTRDFARTWQLLTELEPVRLDGGAFVTSIVIDAEETVYARWFANGGGTWTAKLPAGSQQWTFLEIPDSGYGELFADPKLPGVIYSGTASAFLVTRDGGATWSRLGLPSGAHGFLLAVDLHDSNVLFGIGNGLMRSRDAGRTWEVKVPEANSASHIAISAADGGATIYVDGPGHLLESWLWRSRDRGETWTRVAKLPEGGGLLSMVADPRDADTLYISSLRGGVFRSTDSGATWTSIQEGLPPVGSLAINKSGTMLHAAGLGMWELSVVSGRRRSVK